MKKLRRAFETLLPDATALGGGRHIDRGQLNEILAALSEDLNRAFRTRLAVAALLVCLSLAIAWVFADQPSHLAVGLIGVAVIFAAAVTTLKTVTDEMAQIAFVRSISADVSVESLTELARAIVHSR